MNQKVESFGLPRVWSAMMMLLIAATHPLWVFPPGSDSIPAVGLIAGPVIDHAVAMLPPLLAKLWFVTPTVLLLVGLLAILVDPCRFQSWWWVVAASLVSSFLIDQHRLQPWAYQSALYATIFAVFRPQDAIRVIIPLAASIYIYSGVGKLDYQFAHTVGQNFLGALVSPLGELPDGLDQTTRAALALVFPATEILAGLGLLLPSTRRAAGVMLMVIHVMLIGILGPGCLSLRGLNHSGGVLVWNALLFVQAYLITAKPATSPPQARACIRANRGQSLVIGIVSLAMIAPLFERSGYWDHWTSWALYAPHTSRVEVELHRSALAALPPSLVPFVGDDTDNDGWNKLDLAEWSIHERRVPIYPQSRYQLALAVRLADRLALDDEIRATVRSVSDRRTGRRTERRLLGRTELEHRLHEFWLIW